MIYIYFRSLLESFLQPFFYLQLLSIFAILLFSKFFVFLLQKGLAEQKPFPWSSKLFTFFERERLLRLAQLTITFFLASLCYLILQNSYGNAYLLLFFAYLSLFAILLTIVSGVSKSPPITLLLGGFFAIFLLFSFFERVDPLLCENDAFVFCLGQERLSLYRLLKTILTIGLVIWLTRLFSRHGERYIRSQTTIQADTREWFVKLYEITIYVGAILFILGWVGVDLTGVALFGSAVGVGIGLGLQKIASNFISGIVLLFEKSIKIGDLIELNDQTLGVVQCLDGRAVIIETYDGKEVLVPNEELVTQKVVNWTYSNHKTRLAIEVGISYASDPERARELLLLAASEHPRALKQPPPSCYITDFTSDSIRFLLHFWIADVTKGRLVPKSDVMFSILKKFREEKIVIPCEQREIWIREGESPMRSPAPRDSS